ncbi:MAG: CBS domain-containing protein [Candidatus Ranarchaeia archaeon]
MKDTDPIEVIISQNVRTLEPKNTAEEAIGLFRQGDCKLIVVVDKKGKPLGVVTERTITRGYINPDTKIASILKPVPILSPKTTVAEAAESVLNSGIRYLPVFDHGKLKGVLSVNNLIVALEDPKYKKITLREIMSYKPKTLPVTATIAQALAMARAEGISRIPILRGSELAGIVTLHDIVSKVLYTGSKSRISDVPPPRKTPLGNPVSTIMTKAVVTAPPSLSVSDAIRRMREHKVSSLVIKDNNRVVGIVTRKDLIQLLTEPLKKRDQPMVVQITYKTQPIEIFEREQINDAISRFQGRYASSLGRSYLTIYFKQHRSHREVPLIQCRIRLTTKLGQFVAVAESWGWLNALQNAIENIERQILRDKTILDEHQQLRRFLNKTLSPWQ